jgi:hypothetical protein
MPRRRINVPEFVFDVRSGMSEKELLQKHNLSHKQLMTVYDLLLEDGRLLPSDLENDSTSVFEATVELACHCAYCGALKLLDSDDCHVCGRSHRSSLD